MRDADAAEACLRVLDLLGCGGEASAMEGREFASGAQLLLKVLDDADVPHAAKERLRRRHAALFAALAEDAAGRAGFGAETVSWLTSVAARFGPLLRGVLLEQLLRVAELSCGAEEFSSQDAAGVGLSPRTMAALACAVRSETAADAESACDVLKRCARMAKQAFEDNSAAALAQAMRIASQVGVPLPDPPARGADGEGVEGGPPAPGAAPADWADAERANRRLRSAVYAAWFEACFSPPAEAEAPPPAGAAFSAALVCRYGAAERRSGDAALPRVAAGAAELRLPRRPAAGAPPAAKRRRAGDGSRRTRRARRTRPTRPARRDRQDRRDRRTASFASASRRPRPPSGGARSARRRCSARPSRTWRATRSPRWRCCRST